VAAVGLLLVQAAKEQGAAEVAEVPDVVQVEAEQQVRRQLAGA
jgi:hypothetical protein